MRPILLLVLALLSLPSAMVAKVPVDATEMNLSFAPLVRAAVPAVVNIYATRVVQVSDSPFANDPFFSQFFGQGLSRPRLQRSLGSGVIVRGDGIVVSNYHVVGDARDIRVVLSDRREFDAKVLLADQTADLAVLSLAGARDLPALPLADSDAAEVGDLVLAIGNPFGVGQTVTSGIVSALARSGGTADGAGSSGYFIQTDAAINPGNSGGALIDVRGALLGINTSIVSRSGGSIGIGFAIPANLVARYVAAAEAGQTTLESAWSGADVQEIDADMAHALGLDVPTGVLLQRLHPQSPLLEAGLAEGDVVTMIDGHAVNSAGEFGYRIATAVPGKAVAFGYISGGATRQAMVTLAPAPGGGADDTRTIGTGGPFEGLTIAGITPALIDRLGLPLAASGVIVTGVGGAAQGSGLMPGDVISAVNGQPVSSAAALERIAKQRIARWTVEVTRGDQKGIIRLGD